MNLFDLINHFNYNIVRKKLFRREAEAAYYSAKDIKLPPFPQPAAGDLNNLKSSYPFRFYDDESGKAALVKLLAEAADVNLLIEKARLVMRNVYEMPGGKIIEAGGEIKWNEDYVSGHEYPVHLSWKYDYVHLPPEGADIKNCWYLARFYQGTALGQAYLITGDEAYTEAYLRLFRNFILSNRFCTGVNWVKTSEVSIRLLNVLLSFGYFIDSERVDINVYRGLIDFTLHHSLFIENNIEYTGKRGSSYLINLLALGAAGMLLKESYYGKKNLQASYSGMEQEIRQQVHRDGVSYEQSVPLHTILLEVFLTAKVLFGREGFNFTEVYNDKLKRMFYAQAAYLRGDGTVPQVGDAVISRIFPFNILNAQPDHSSIMAAGACMFGEPEFKTDNRLTPEIVLLFGSGAAADYEKLPAEPADKTAAFMQGGHFIMRSPDLHMFIEAGEIGKRGLGAPGHNDTFSFELVYKGDYYIVDPGTYSIYADKQMRNSLRSIKNHNTSYIDDEELSELEGLFKIKDDITKPRVLEWRTDNEEDLLAVQHYGYAKLADPVIIKRTFNYRKAERKIIITDEFLGGGSHQININFIISPSARLTESGVNEYTLSGENGSVKINFTRGGYFKSAVIPAHYSKRYGTIGETKKIAVSFTGRLPADFKTEIELG